MLIGQIVAIDAMGRYYAAKMLQLLPSQPGADAAKTPVMPEFILFLTVGGATSAVLLIVLSQPIAPASEILVGRDRPGCISAFGRNCLPY